MLYGVLLDTFLFVFRSPRSGLFTTALQLISKWVTCPFLMLFFNGYGFCPQTTASAWLFFFEILLNVLWEQNKQDDLCVMIIFYSLVLLSCALMWSVIVDLNAIIGSSILNMWWGKLFRGGKDLLEFVLGLWIDKHTHLQYIWLNRLMTVTLPLFHFMIYATRNHVQIRLSLKLIMIMNKILKL